MLALAKSRIWQSRVALGRGESNVIRTIAQKEQHRMSTLAADELSQRRRPAEPRFVPTAGKRVLGYFAVCCPVERPISGGTANRVSKIHDLPPGTSDIQVWVAGWDFQFTRAGSTAGAERMIAHAGVHAYAFQKENQWFVQTSMILASLADDTHWFGWVDLLGIAIG